MTTYIIVIATAFALSFLMALWGWWVRGMEIREERWVRLEPFPIHVTLNDVDYEAGTVIEKIERMDDGLHIRKIDEYKIYTN